MQELLIIMGVALIVFGPRKLPTIGKTLGKTVREFRSQSQQLRNTLEREVQMEEFRQARQEVAGLGRDLGKGLDPDARPQPSSSGPSGPAAAPSKPAEPKTAAADGRKTAPPESEESESPEAAATKGSSSA